MESRLYGETSPPKPKDGDEAEIFAAAFDDFAQRFETFILTPFHIRLADVPNIAAQ